MNELFSDSELPSHYLAMPLQQTKADAPLADLLDISPSQTPDQARINFNFKVFKVFKTEEDDLSRPFYGPVYLLKPAPQSFIGFKLLLIKRFASARKGNLLNLISEIASLMSGSH